MKRAFPIHSTSAESVWHQALPFVERAMKFDNGRETPETHLEKIKTCERQLWFGTEDDDLRMVAITTIDVWPEMKVARFMILGGEDVDGWWAFARPMFAEWAQREGCTQFEVKGRKGWLKKLRGWALDHVVMRTEVAHGR